MDNLHCIRLIFDVGKKGNQFRDWLVAWLFWFGISLMYLTTNGNLFTVSLPLPSHRGNQF